MAHGVQDAAKCNLAKAPMRDEHPTVCPPTLWFQRFFLLLWELLTGIQG